LKNNVKLAFCAMITALAVVVMMLTVFPYATYALPGVAGVLMVVLVIEINKKWALGAFAATGLLSAIIAPDKEAALMFIMFLGYYPIIKSVFERIKSKAVEFFLKFSVFNAAVITSTLIATQVLNIPVETVSLFGKYTWAALLVLGNITFLMYDYAINGVVVKYLNTVHPYIKKIINK